MMGHYGDVQEAPRLSLADQAQQVPSSWALFEEGWSCFWDGRRKPTAWIAGYVVGIFICLSILSTVLFAGYSVLRAVAAAPLLFQLVLGFSAVSLLMFAAGMWWAGRQLRHAEKTR